MIESHKYFGEMVGLLKLAKESAYSLGWRLTEERPNEIISRDDLKKEIKAAFEGWNMEWVIRGEDGKVVQTTHDQVIDHLTSFLWNWVGWGSFDACK